MIWVTDLKTTTEIKSWRLGFDSFRFRSTFGGHQISWSKFEDSEGNLSHNLNFFLLRMRFPFHIKPLCQILSFPHSIPTIGIRVQLVCILSRLFISSRIRTQLSCFYLILEINRSLGVGLIAQRLWGQWHRHISLNCSHQSDMVADTVRPSRIKPRPPRTIY